MEVKSFENHVSEALAELKATDMKVGEGRMKYYTADEIKTRLENVLCSLNLRKN